MQTRGYAAAVDTNRTLSGGSMWQRKALWCAVVVLVTVLGEARVTADCGVAVEGRAHARSVLADNVTFATGLAVHFATRTLYFSYEGDSNLSGRINLNTGEFSEIKELRLCTFAVDQSGGRVYAGCEGGLHGEGGGLYVLQPGASQGALLAAGGRRVRFAHHDARDDAVYYSVFPDFLLRVYRAGAGANATARPHGLLWVVDDLVVAGNGDLVFHDGLGVYRTAADGAFLGRYRGLDAPRSLALDASGAVHAVDFGWKAGAAVFRLRDRPPAAQQLLPRGRFFGLAFDADGSIIYSNDTNIVRLQRC